MSKKKEKKRGGKEEGVALKRILDVSSILKRKGLFLFGPRQTGKTSFLKYNYKDAIYIDLLMNELFSEYNRSPASFRKRVELVAKKDPNAIIIVDEIQRIPKLLNEIHLLIEDHKKLRFILTGSSARRLKKEGTNLLGGRVSLQYFFPICYKEILESSLEFDLQKILSYGLLPAILCSQDPYADLLDYVGLYLKEEIKFEGLVRELNIFAEFLRLAALSNTEQIVYSNFAHDAQISVPTAKEYFQILEDTLIGYQLSPFLQTKKRKAMSSTKFYFFDCGVVNAILQRKEMIEGTVEYGKQFEQFIFQELRAYLQINRLQHRLEYWRSQKKDEVDFILYDSLKNIVAIEVKSSKRPRPSDAQGILKLEEEFSLKRKIVICNTEHSYLEDDIEYLSVSDFLDQLWTHKIAPI